MEIITDALEDVYKRQVPKKLQNDFLHQMYEDFGTIEEDCFYDRLEDGKYDEGFKERQVKEEKSR